MNRTSPAPSDAMRQWMGEVHVRPVVPDATGHVVHSYFNASPESPDGRYVAYFQAVTPNAHHGDVCVIDRATGDTRVLAHGIENEDGHRVAYQQWSCNGRSVVFHALHENRWRVIRIDIDTGERAELAEGRQLGFGDPAGPRVPLHGPHWSPGEHRDLELLNVETGEIETILTPDDVRDAYPAQIADMYGDAELSIFFPILAPSSGGGGERVMFKLASPNDGTFRSRHASTRHGLIVYDIANKRFLHCQKSWGHPSWHPDGRTILNVPNTLFDSDSGALSDIPGLPKFPGSHPTVSPDGCVFASDLHNKADVAEDVRWSVAVCDLAGHHHRVLHTFHRTPVTSWRPPHPHPAFSADGTRLYFNASDEKVTRLHVAER